MANWRNRLEAKVKARNTAVEYGISLYKQLVEVFEPLVGQKILKVDNDLLAKVKANVPKFDDLPEGISIFRRFAAVNAIAWTVKVRVPVEDDEIWVYQEVTVYVADMEGQTLTKINNPFEGRTDWTADEVEEKRRAYKEAKKKADEAHSALYPFGEHDH
jgi:hypothetical protein